MKRKKKRKALPRQKKKPEPIRKKRKGKVKHEKSRRKKVQGKTRKVRIKPVKKKSTRKKSVTRPKKRKQTTRVVKRKSKPTKKPVSRLKKKPKKQTKPRKKRQKKIPIDTGLDGVTEGERFVTKGLKYEYRSFFLPDFDASTIADIITTVKGEPKPWPIAFFIHLQYRAKDGSMGDMGTSFFKFNEDNAVDAQDACIRLAMQYDVESITQIEMLCTYSIVKGEK